jgi:hypothetical protein
MINKLINWIIKLFNKPLPRGKTYDMSKSCYGHSIQWTNWPDMCIHGWMNPRPLRGDVVICKFQSGKILEFQITSVEYCNDPNDMFFAYVKYFVEEN